MSAMSPDVRSDASFLKGLPNGSRLSCGALMKKSSFNTLRAPAASGACQAAPSRLWRLIARAPKTRVPIIPPMRKGTAYQGHPRSHVMAPKPPTKHTKYRYDPPRSIWSS